MSKTGYEKLEKTFVNILKAFEMCQRGVFMIDDDLSNIDTGSFLGK